MKKEYRKPVVKYVDFRYDTQVTATSVRYCDQGWTLGTTLNPTGTCAKCHDDLIWLNEVNVFSF